MSDGRNSRQKVTRTLLVTSLFICAGLFLFLIFEDISAMKEGGGKYLNYNFGHDGGVKSMLSRLLSGEQPAAVSPAAPELVQEQPALVAAGEAARGDIPETAAPAGAQNAPPPAGNPSFQSPSAPETGEAAPPGGQAGSAGTATSAGPQKAPSGSSKRPQRETAPLPSASPPADAGGAGPAKIWRDADLSINGILASAGIIRGEKSLLSLASLKAGPGSAPAFDPGKVLALGGRLGQGLISMESGSGADRSSFDLNAQGLSATLGPEPAGPAIPAGKAPALPSGHVAYIIEAARAEGIDPALLAATAARESNFRPKAYRAEPHLSQVKWRAAPGRPLNNYYDGSIGPTQVLRSNFKAQGIDNDAQAYDLRNNYRISARIIKSNLSYFPGNTWKAIAAYNVGKYGAKIGRVPANNYTDTIISWRGEYKRALGPYQ